MARKSIVIGVVLALTVLAGSPTLAESGCGCGKTGDGNVIEGVLQFGGNLWNGLTDSIGSLFGKKPASFEESPKAESTGPEKAADDPHRWLFDSTNW
jgi:hypothetical protein